ncbi:MAG TPA: type III-A CRISPR-associated RAMP protein Csm3 [Nitrospirae bacterium]|nr:RAMP superfamily protein [bacterium BMS3Abin06]HDH12659.1 type III-A CRISPR-associated RAMP protein Csm3 [Nitrospirota bacterium]HDY99967.1 type III-A CRISPR-associated RAMP protein Csm3 [Nitrospirota bacterium]
MKLKKYLSLTGVLHCKTQLRIGGTKDGIVEPGGVDNPIIRHPVTSLPYVPGSSIKGKMRSLLELDKETGSNIRDNGKPCECGACLVCKVFGSHGMNNKEITRILVRDCPVTQESETTLRELQAEKGMNFADIKSENIINRKTGTTIKGGLRTQETIPAGTQFSLTITVKLFDNDNEEKITEFVRKGLSLLEKDYLGGSGSRGYGQVEIKNLEIKEL